MIAAGTAGQAAFISLPEKRFTTLSSKPTKTPNSYFGLKKHYE